MKCCAWIHEREANVQDVANGIAGSSIVGLHANSYGAPRLARVAESVRLPSAISRSSGKDDEGSSRQGRPIARYGSPTEDQSQFAAGRRLSR